MKNDLQTLQAHHDLMLSYLKELASNHHGKLTFHDYMQAVLYAPNLGYYTNTSQKFGALGDFTTAPEVSPLFSHCIARQFSELLADIPQAQILEFGAGSGKMALDILTYLDNIDALPNAYFILEISPSLRQRQQQLLQAKAPQFLKLVSWIDHVPENFNGMIVANEVLDAMPVHLVDFEQRKECCVSFHDNQFILTMAQSDNAVLNQKINTLADHYQFQQPYMSEINLNIAPWIKKLSRALQQGIILLIDYGFAADEFFHPQRHQGTLMCHYKQQTHPDPFVNPGLQDITAHVNFSDVANACAANALTILGYITQANFLLNLGITDLAMTVDNDLKLQLANSKQLQTLLMPHEMGELFKVFAASKNCDIELSGFARNNHPEKL